MSWKETVIIYICINLFYYFTIVNFVYFSNNEVQCRSYESMDRLNMMTIIIVQSTLPVDILVTQ